MQIRENKAKKILDAGGFVVTSSVRLPEPGLCEILGYAGFDLVVIDGEHGAMDPSSLDRLTQSCYASDTVPLYRVLKNNDPEDIMRALDLGVQGIVLPHCRTADDARGLQRAAFYAPRGARGFGPGRGTRWGRVPARGDYFERANETILLTALVEDVEGVENIDEIAAAGLDVLWAGTGDLAVDYGVPGERDHAKVKEAASRILEACQRHKVASGYPARSIEEAHWAREQGYRAIGYGGAEGYVMEQSRQFLDSLDR